MVPVKAVCKTCTAFTQGDEPLWAKTSSASSMQAAKERAPMRTSLVRERGKRCRSIVTTPFTVRVWRGTGEEYSTRLLGRVLTRRRFRICPLLL